MAFLLFDSGVTFNALAIPTTLDAQGGGEANPSGDLYHSSNLQNIVDPFGDGFPPLNLAGNDGFVLYDYATGEKTLEDAFRLKLGLETIGTPPPPRPPEPPKPPVVDPTGDPENVPEPSSILGLLVISILALLPGKNKGT